jgi:hypothetical protein
MVGETSWGIWVGLIESNKVLTIPYIFICIRGKDSALVQLINYHLCNLLSLGLKNHALETTLELWICAVGDLSMSNLAYTARLLDCQRPTLVVNMKISFISLFFVLGWRFPCILHYDMFPTPFRDQPNRLSLCLHFTGFLNQISGANHSSLSLKVSWMVVYSEIYGGWLRTADNWGLAVVLFD